MANLKAEREKRTSPVPASKPTKGKTGTGFSPVVWRTVQFTADQKIRAKEQEFDPVKALDTLAYLVEHGHKLSFNPQTSDGFVGASVWGHTDECPNKGFGVSGEGRTLPTALKSLLLKLDILDYDLRLEDVSDEDDFR